MSSSIPNIPPPADQIRSLMEMERRIPKLLTLLSCSLTALLPPNPDAPKVYHEDGSLQDEEERFVDSAREYYSEIDDITLLLRSTIHHLRLARVLPTPNDFVPPPPNQLPPTPFSAPLPASAPSKPKSTFEPASAPTAAASSSSSQLPSAASAYNVPPTTSADPSTTPILGLYALRVEAGIWRTLRDSLVAMREDAGGEAVEEVAREAATFDEAFETSSAKQEVVEENEDEDEEMEEVPEASVGTERRGEGE